MTKKTEPKNLSINLSETIKLRDTIFLKSFRGTKKFISYIISGWFPSIRKDLSSEGVNKVRVIDRQNDKYQEKVTDIKTGRVIHDVDEKLSDHK